jgi:predicted transcriptional regulator with HTH domain
MKDRTANQILETLQKNEELRREVIHELARTYPKEFLSRVKIDPTRVKDALDGVVVSCKEWQE